MAAASQTPENAGDAGNTPAPQRRYRCRLKTVQDVSRELARIYRESRSGIIPVEHASKYANVLSIIGRIMADSDLEERIERLEGRAK